LTHVKDGIDIFLSVSTFDGDTKQEFPYFYNIGVLSNDFLDIGSNLFGVVFGDLLEDLREGDTCGVLSDDRFEVVGV
jgi:hypothetical protein